MCKACVSNVAWTTWDDCIVQTHKGLGVLWLSKWRKLHPYLWKYISSFVTTPLYKEWIIWATSGRLLTITFSCYIMVIELGGVKFCLKSFGFQNQTSAWQGFIWNRKNCNTRSSISTLLHPFWNRKTMFCWFNWANFTCNLIDILKASSFARKKKRFRAKNGAFHE